ncbi:ATP-binding protein [Kitasatospora mediocidica]|uniref:ATP-binding protein n=1 Tax=Kitasatospora mediocidica TaxID=58352 RepID=UPI000689D6C8|nr:ATP-binding protein [Kitasatospora mediocidica]
MSETVACPPAPPIETACWFPRHPKSAGRARMLLREFLSTRPGGELYVEAAELVLSELVTNALVHARTSPGRLIMVRFELPPDRLLLIEVHDASPKAPTARRATGPEGSEAAESGRGLVLVEALSTDWGSRPRAGGVGKCVWAIVAPEGSGPDAGHDCATL